MLATPHDQQRITVAISELAQQITWLPAIQPLVAAKQDDGLTHEVAVVVVVHIPQHVDVTGDWNAVATRLGQQRTGEINIA